MAFYLLRMLLVFVAAVTLMMNWRASLTLTFCLLVDFVGMLGNVAQPNNFWNQVLGYVLLGALFGAVVSAGRYDPNVKWLPRLAALLMLVLTLSWGAEPQRVWKLWWLYLHRVIVLPGAMLAVVSFAERYKRRGSIRAILDSRGGRVRGGFSD